MGWTDRSAVGTGVGTGQCVSCIGNAASEDGSSVLLGYIPDYTELQTKIP